jgi:hypothetical protein
LNIKIPVGMVWNFTRASICPASTLYRQNIGRTFVVDILEGALEEGFAVKCPIYLS